MSASLQSVVLPAHPGVSVRAFEPRDLEVWNAFVRAHPEGTFFHLAEWQQVLREAFRHRTYYLLAERGGEIHGVLPLAHVSSRLFGSALISTPFCVYGGVVASDDAAARALTDEACNLARRLGVDYLELRNRRRRNPQWPARDLYVTFRKQILPESEANMLAIPRKQRAMVRKGIQKGLRSRIDGHVADHYELYSESLRNLGTPVFSRHYLETLRKVFGSDCEILTITHESVPVASVLSFYFRDEVLPYYGGGGAAARPVAANDFMYWEVMERARQRGSRLFDYGRSKRDTGSFEFKVHWGFEPEPLHYEYFLVKAQALPNLSPTNPKYQRMIRLWQRLPLAVTQRLGPWVARYLG
jgi:FemAB-related protein (PEP-CTERM system-associated)